MKIEEPTTPALQLGVQVHASLEQALSTNLSVPADHPLAEVCRRELIKQKLIDVDHREVVSEYSLSNISLAGVPVKGFIDVLSWQANVGLCAVVDMKTTSGWKWAVTTEDELRRNTQMMLYAHAALDKYNLDQCTIAHVTVHKKTYEVKYTSTIVTRDLVEDFILSLEDTVRLMLASAQETDPDKVPGNIEECGSFGGCPHAKSGLCSMVRSHLPQKEYPMSNATPEQLNNATNLLRGLRAKVTPTKVVPPTPTPTKVVPTKVPNLLQKFLKTDTPEVKKTDTPAPETTAHPFMEAARKIVPSDAQPTPPPSSEGALRKAMVEADNLSKFPLDVMATNRTYHCIISGELMKTFELGASVPKLKQKQIDTIKERVGGDTFVELWRWLDLKQNKIQDIAGIGKKGAEKVLGHMAGHPEIPKTELHPDHPWSENNTIKHDPIHKDKEGVRKPKSARLSTTQDTPSVDTKKDKIVVALQQKEPATQGQDVVDAILELRTKVMGLDLDKVAQGKVMDALHEAAVWTKFRW